MRFLTALAVLLLAGTTAVPAMAQSDRDTHSSVRFERVQYERVDPRIGQLAQQYSQPQQYGQSQPYSQDGRPGNSYDRNRNRGINITAAYYGVENRACEATRQASRLCEGKSSCTIPASNRLCGDPVPGIVKVLTVHYECHGRQRSMTRREGTHLGLRCDPQRRY
jgi:hypothetical protein